MKSFSLSLLTAALIPAVATAQFDSDIGSALGVGDDTNSDVVSAFAVTFPDGTSTTDIRIDANGRISKTSDADGSDFSESEAEHNGLAQIAVMWDDLSPQIVGDVFFYTDATKTNVTWIECEDFTFDGNYTFQLQIDPSGVLTMVYDSRVTGQDGLVGTSDGSGAGTADDLSAGVTGDANAYELFGSGAFDLGDSVVVWAPDGMGGYDVSSTAGAGMAPMLPFLSDGAVSDTGESTNRAYTYTPDGMGGYTITRGTGLFIDDSMASSDLNALASGSGDDELYTVTLGFPFTMPDGTVITDAVIDTNGRILADSSDGSDFSPSIGEALTGAPAAIVPFWCDMSPQLGTFTFSTTASEAIITMLDAPQFAESNAISWQAILRSDNSFTINYIDASTWRTGFGSTTDDVIAGCFSGTGGAGTDPGEGNHGDAVNMSNGEGTFYEFWDATTNDNPTMGPVLDANSATLGADLDLTADGISTGAPASLFFGFANPGDLPLDIIGVEGGELSTSADVVIPLAVMGNSADFVVALPGDPGFVGLLVLDLQVAYISFGDTSLGAVLTNGVNVTF